MHDTPLAVAEPESWDTLPGARLIHVIEAFDLCGVDVRDSLDAFGMASPLRNDMPVDAGRATAWLEHMLDVHPQRGFGLKFSRIPTALDHGLVGYTILSSDTVGEAMINRIRFAALMRPPLGLRLQQCVVEKLAVRAPHRLDADALAEEAGTGLLRRLGALHGLLPVEAVGGRIGDVVASDQEPGLCGVEPA